MQDFIIFLYILAFAFVSTILWILLSRDRRKEWISQQTIREIVFFFFCNFFLLSVVKLVLGSAESTLFESFWDIQLKTYVNYAMPLLAFSVIVPIVVRFLFKENALKLIRGADAIMFISLIVVLLLRGQISNSGYCVVFLISAVGALGYSVLQKQEMEYIEVTEYKKYALKMLPAISAWIVTVGIYLPNELYLANYSQFSGPFWNVLCHYADRKHNMWSDNPIGRATVIA